MLQVLVSEWAPNELNKIRGGKFQVLSTVCKKTPDIKGFSTLKTLEEAVIGQYSKLTVHCYPVT